MRSASTASSRWTWSIVRFWGVHRRFPELLRIHFAEALIALDDDAAVAAQLVELGVHRFVRVVIPDLFALAHLIQGRLGDVYMAFRNERLHKAVEERQQERADMGSVDVGIGHDDDLVVTPLADVEFFADARAEGRNHGADFFIGQDLVQTGLFDVDDLAAGGKMAWNFRSRPCLPSRRPNRLRPGRFPS